MHDAEVIHGDLTTSNVIVRCTDAAISADVVIIDFGLGTMKPTMEDKAVDLYVLERAFISTHPGSEFIVSALLESYRFTSRKGTPTLQKLEQVQICAILVRLLSQYFSFALCVFVVVDRCGCVAARET